MLDFAFLDEQSFGDRALQAELLDLYEIQCRRLMPVIEASASPGAAAEAAHTLRGSAAAIGAREVARIAGLVENAAEQGGEGSREALVAALRDAVETARLAIAGGRVRP